MYKAYLINSMYFVPHFGHAKVYETSIWTPCFQILAKTMGAKLVYSPTQVYLLTYLLTYLSAT